MDRLKQEFDGLLYYIHRVRQEIAAIYRPADEDHNFDSMGDQLGAIVNATEEATNAIMEAMERNVEAVGKLRDKITDPDQAALLDHIIDNGNDVFESCSFQDITGQRVNKVVKSITYVEKRVIALVGVLGEAQVAEVEVPVDRGETADEQLVRGPQLEGDGLSQDDVNKLFD